MEKRTVLIRVNAWNLISYFVLNCVYSKIGNISKIISYKNIYLSWKLFYQIFFLKWNRYNLFSQDHRLFLLIFIASFLSTFKTINISADLIIYRFLHFFLFINWWIFKCYLSMFDLSPFIIVNDWYSIYIHSFRLNM